MRGHFVARENYKMATRINTESTAAVTQLGYLGFSVSNMDAWKEFATEVLGVQVNGNTEDGTMYLRTDSYHHRFEIIPTGADDIAFHGWEVKDAAALDQLASQVRAYGIEVTKGTPEEIARRMVVDLFHFKDPDGLHTEVYYGARLDHTAFVSPRGVKGFNADRLGLGHMVLMVKDAKEYVKFYTEVMGAKLSDYINMSFGEMKMTLTFMHVNPRHHSLAIGQSRPGAPGKRINHFMLEVNDMDDVGYARGLFERRAIPVGNFGRHTNDKMFSFYGETPSGFNVEYGFNGLQILDEENWEVSHHTAASIWGHAMPQRAAPPAAAAAADPASGGLSSAKTPA